MSDKFLVLDDSSTIHKVIELAFPADAVEVVSPKTVLRPRISRKYLLASF